mgnify:CR=1 FL=1
MHAHKPTFVHTRRPLAGFVFALFLLAIPGLCSAAEIGQIIYLEADTVDIDEKKGISVYKGNVKLSRGDITIVANMMTVYKNDSGLQKLIATGKPVEFTKAASTNINGAKQKEMKGQALEIDYNAKNEIIKLKNDAKLWQGKDQFSGNIIVYDIASETVTASKGSASNGRVKVIIHPDTDTSQSNK